MTDRLMPLVTPTADHVWHFAATYILCYSSCVKSIMRLLYGRYERLFLTELKNKYFTRQIFYRVF